jgi:S-adenosylhomocysteine hydrolase
VDPVGGNLARELGWLREFTPATRRAAASLPPLRGERVLVVCHLDPKMVPYFDALTGAGAEIWACAANPATTRDAVTIHLQNAGVHLLTLSSPRPGGPALPR